MKPIHLLIAAFIVIAFAFIAYRGGEAPVKASSAQAVEPPSATLQAPQNQ